MTLNALTYTANNIVDTIITPIEVVNTFTGVSISSKGLWDTGAQGSCITVSAVNALGLKSLGKVRVKGVHGVEEVDYYQVKLILNNRAITEICLATECAALSDGDDVAMLIGMNVINRGDFCISNFDGRTTMTFRVPSVVATDYVAEIKERNKLFKIHQAWSRHGNNKCPCGSGKLWKNCHGKE